MARIVQNTPGGFGRPAHRGPSRISWAHGVTLIELVVATMILAVASLGALTYQYHAVKRARMARSEITAAQLAQLLIEDWKSNGGNEFYNPTNLNLGLESTPTTGIYKIIFNDFPMRVALWQSNVATDTAAGVTLREIRVTVSWRRDYLDLTPGDSDPTFTATTYVRRDMSGG